MTTWMTRRTLLAAIGALLLAGIAFAAGAWVGGDVVGSFHGFQVLPRSSANADALLRRLVLVDRGDVNALREELSMELDGELVAICVLAKERAGSSDEAITRARTILQRIATYRSETPPVYPAAYATQRNAKVTNLLRTCLSEAAGTSGR